MKSQLKIIIGVFAIIIAFVFTNCGENVDPAKADLKIVMKATADLASVNAGGRIAETELEFTEARIGVTEVEFESIEWDGVEDGDHDSNEDMNHDGNHSENEFEIEYEGQFIVDLLAGTSNPDFGITDLFPGAYNKIEVKMRPVMADGNSLFIAFNYQPDGADPVRVEISTSMELEFEIEKHEGIVLEENMINQILILFDLDKILEGVDFSLANIDNDGVLRINDTTNTALTGSIISNFYDACDAGEDHDGDDKFDDDHHSDDE